MTEEPEYLEENSPGREPLVRKALINLPLAFITAAVFSVSLSGFLGGSIGAIFPMFILGVIAFAFASEGLTALRDLNAQPITTVGQVRRSWSRGAVFWFIRSHYVFVDKTVFTVSAITGMSLEPGDTVEIEHWPHTKHVIRVRMLEQQPRSRAAPPDNTRRLRWRGR